MGIQNILDEFSNYRNLLVTLMRPKNLFDLHEFNCSSEHSQ